LGVPGKTVEKIYKENKDKAEFAKLCAEKKIDFAKKAGELIDKGLALLERRFDVALLCEAEIGVLIDEINKTGGTEISQDLKNRLVGKLRALEMQSVGDIVKAVGVLYDKRALANGDSTENVTFKLPRGIEKYAE
jgi:hypothetical protein